jgi:hypothetical protein
MARVEAERLARAPYVNSVDIWLRIAPVMMDELEAERGLYAVKPTRRKLLGNCFQMVWRFVRCFGRGVFFAG